MEFGYRLMLFYFITQNCFLFLSKQEEKRFTTQIFFDVSTPQLFFYHAYQVMYLVVISTGKNSYFGILNNINQSMFMINSA